MIDQFCIFERGGTVLWSRNFVDIKGNPVATLVRSVLLEDRLSIPELSVEQYTLRWSLDNQRGLIFVVVFQKRLPPAYANDLLHYVHNHFTRVEVKDGAQLDPFMELAHFDAVFDKLLNSAERKSMNNVKTSRAIPKKPTSEATTAVSSDDSVLENHDDCVSSINVEDMQENLAKLASKRGGRGSRKAGAATRAKAKSSSNATGTVPESAPWKKIMRPGNKPTKEDLAALDFSEGKPPDGMADESEAAKFRKQYLDAERNTALDDILESSDDEDVPDKTTSGGIFNYFKGLAGMRTLTESDLRPVMDQFRDALVGKNMAKDIADKLMMSVLHNLEGKTMESFTTVTTMVRSALEDALTRILTPQQSTDILADIAANKGSSNPYVITFCGVNGVGKSTSLAKTCFYLLNHGYKVMIAACDTFRAGAVEQLRTHVRCLGKGVELFDRGYGKDAAAVAADAIRQARDMKYDVVLVDTAGRMQDNEPLMRALSKLVEVNRPDRVFFVGEALVGNDAVDQLTKFNAALTDHQSSARPRLIDGIVLTKFDTIDDKVGAAVSMVYTTGQPIVFIGIGQTYMDLRKLNTKAIVKALLI